MIIPYAPDLHQSVLIRILRLNTPEFFDTSEEADFVHYLTHEAMDYFVVVHEGKVVGSGGFNYVEDGKVARISWDLFDPQAQGKGFGRALVSYRIEQIQKNSNVESICVRTSQLVFKFYEKAGFKLTEVVKDYWAKGYDMYYMEFSK